MNLKTSHLTRILLGIAALVLVSAGCNTNEASSPTQPTVQPVEPQFAPIVTVTSDRSRLATDTERGANIRVRAVNRQTGFSVPNLTIANVTTNLGAFGSQSGDQEVELEFFEGVARTVFFPGTEPGTATIRAEVNGGVDIVFVQIVCPAEGCGGGDDGGGGFF